MWNLTMQLVSEQEQSCDNNGDMGGPTLTRRRKEFHILSNICFSDLLSSISSKIWKVPYPHIPPMEQIDNIRWKGKCYGIQTRVTSGWFDS